MDIYDFKNKIYLKSRDVHVKCNVSTVGHYCQDMTGLLISIAQDAVLDILSHQPINEFSAAREVSVTTRQLNKL